MRVWIALLIAPTMALLDQAIAYATAGRACARQDLVIVHGVHAIFLVALVGTTLLAWQAWREAAHAPSTGESHARRKFVAGLALASSAFSALVVASLWMPSWLLSNCIA